MNGFNMEVLKELLDKRDKIDEEIRLERDKCNHDWEFTKREFNMYHHKCTICGAVKQIIK